MQRFYSIVNGKIIESKTQSGSIQVFTTPNNKERQVFIQQLGVDSYDFDAALDPDEISRVEFEKDLTTIIWKQPCYDYLQITKI